MRKLLAVLCYFLAGMASGASVNLAWDAPSDTSQIVGYRIGYGTQSGAYSQTFDAGNALTATISGLNDGTTYFFAAKSYGGVVAESVYSNEVSSRTPDGLPQASFSANPSSGVAPLSVTFSNLSTGATSYAWAFGDGGTSTATSPTYVYQSPGSFNATLTATGNGSSQASSLITVTQAPPPPPPGGESLFTSQTPTLLHTTEPDEHELGMRFMSSVAGQVVGIRFWKDSYESGAHIGRLWNAGGVQLAAVTFVNETPSGWQTQNLATQIDIQANTEYLVSVNTGATAYVDTIYGLQSVISNGHLSSFVGSNGRFGTVNQYPTQSWNASNYFRDVVFVADTTPPPPPPPSDTTPPVVTISSPADGASLKGSGKVTISASATDNVGVVAMTLSIDGATVASGVASVSYSWNLRNAAQGQHTISATARDAGGNQAVKTITVTRGGQGAVKVTR